MNRYNSRASTSSKKSSKAAAENYSPYSSARGTIEET